MQLLAFDIENTHFHFIVIQSKINLLPFPLCSLGLPRHLSKIRTKMGREAGFILHIVRDTCIDLYNQFTKPTLQTFTGWLNVIYLC